MDRFLVLDYPILRPTYRIPNFLPSAHDLDISRLPGLCGVSRVGLALEAANNLKHDQRGLVIAAMLQPHDLDLSIIERHDAGKRRVDIAASKPCHVDKITWSRFQAVEKSSNSSTMRVHQISTALPQSVRLYRPPLQVGIW